MTRNSKRKLAATLVVTLAVADGVGIYVAQNKLDKPTDIGPRELAVANEALAEPIAIRTDGEFTPAPALAQSVVVPHAAPGEAGVPQTVRFAIADPVRAPVAAKAPEPASAALAVRTARQTAPVVTGRMAAVDKPVSRRAEPRHSSEIASRAERHEDLQVHQQRIPARLTRAERRPYREDAFAAAFGNVEEQVRLPEPAYGGPDPQPRGQASAELPPLELSTAQIHYGQDGKSDADAPPAPPPATAAGAEDALPKS